MRLSISAHRGPLSHFTVEKWSLTVHTVRAPKSHRLYGYETNLVLSLIVLLLRMTYSCIAPWPCCKSLWTKVTAKWLNVNIVDLTLATKFEVNWGWTMERSLSLAFKGILKVPSSIIQPTVTQNPYLTFSHVCETQKLNILRNVSVIFVSIQWKSMGFSVVWLSKFF